MKNKRWRWGWEVDGGSGTLEWQYMSYVFLNNHFMEWRFWFWLSWSLKQKGKLYYHLHDLQSPSGKCILFLWKKQKFFSTLGKENKVTCYIFRQRCSEWNPLQYPYRLGVMGASGLSMLGSLSVSQGHVPLGKNILKIK